MAKCLLTVVHSVVIFLHTVSRFLAIPYFILSDLDEALEGVWARMKVSRDCGSL